MNTETTYYQSCLYLLLLEDANVFAWPQNAAMEGHPEAVCWVSVGSATNAQPTSILKTVPQVNYICSTYVLSVMFITGEKEGLNQAALLE